MSLFGPSYPVLRRVIVNTRTEKAFRGGLRGNDMERRLAASGGGHSSDGVTNADWIEGLTTLTRSCMMIVRWAQKMKKRLEDEEGNGQAAKDLASNPKA